MRKKREVILLLIAFFAGTLVWGAIASACGEYVVHYDEVVHAKTAQSFAAGTGRSFRGFPLNYSAVLYYFFAAPAFLFSRNAVQSHNILLWINAALMSSAVIPVYLIANEVLKSKKYVWLSVGSSLVFSEMCYTMFAIQENLFYPLSLWFYYLFLRIMRGTRNRFLYAVVFAVISFILYTAKDMGLVLFLSVIMYCVAGVVLNWDKDRKWLIEFLFAYLALFLLLMHVYTRLIYSSGGGAGGTVGSAIHSITDFSIVIRLIYPALVYWVAVTIATGLMPIPLIIGNFGDMNLPARRLALLTACNIIAAVGTICVLILSEHFGLTAIRIHTRYFYHVFILALILTCHTMERATERPLHKEVAICAMLCAVTAFLLLPISPSHGSPIDSVTLRLFRQVSGDELLSLTAKLLILLFSVFLVILLLFNKYRALHLSGLFFLAFLTVSGSMITIRELANVRKNTEDVRNDAIVIDEYLTEQAQKGEEISLLLIGQDIVTEATFECYLNIPYRFALYRNFADRFCTEKRVDFAALSYTGFNTDYTDSEGKLPDYIIMPSEHLKIGGVEPVDISLKGHSLYHRVADNIFIISAESGVYVDRWVEPVAKLTLLGTEGYTRAYVSLTVDNPLFGGAIEVKYTDGSGNTGNVTVPFATYGEPVSIEIPVYKQPEQTVYQLTLEPQRTTRVNSDSRDLSFRLFDAVITREESEAVIVFPTNSEVGAEKSDMG